MMCLHEVCVIWKNLVQKNWRPYVLMSQYKCVFVVRRCIRIRLTRGNILTCLVKRSQLKFYVSWWDLSRLSVTYWNTIINERRDTKMFSKEHYVVLAWLIKSSPDLERFTEYLIDRLKRDNERFDEEKFREAIKRWLEVTVEEQIIIGFIVVVLSCLAVYAYRKLCWR